MTIENSRNIDNNRYENTRHVDFEFRTFMDGGKPECRKVPVFECKVEAHIPEVPKGDTYQTLHRANKLDHRYYYYRPEDIETIESRIEDAKSMYRQMTDSSEDTIYMSGNVALHYNRLPGYDDELECFDEHEALAGYESDSYLIEEQLPPVWFLSDEEKGSGTLYFFSEQKLKDTYDQVALYKDELRSRINELSAENSSFEERLLMAVRIGLADNNLKQMIMDRALLFTLKVDIDAVKV